MGMIKQFYSGLSNVSNKDNFLLLINFGDGK